MMNREDHDEICPAFRNGGAYPTSDDIETSGCWVCDCIRTAERRTLSEARAAIEDAVPELRLSHNDGRGGLLMRDGVTVTNRKPETFAEFLNKNSVLAYLIALTPTLTASMAKPNN